MLHEKIREIAAVRRNDVLVETRHGPGISSLPLHFHEEFQVILSEKRLISYTLKGRTILSPLSSVFIIEPEIVHSASVEQVQPTWGELRTLLISRASFQQYLGEQARRLCFPTAVNTSRSLLSCLRLTHTVMEAARDQFVIESALTEGLQALAKHSRNYKSSATPRCERRMRAVRDRLASDLSNSLRLSEVAQSVDLSPFYVIRQFHKLFGLTPHAFRTQLRVARARELLLARVPITEVALSMGFSDHAHFTRTFHRIVGVPPSRYRNGNFVQDAAALPL